MKAYSGRRGDRSTAIRSITTTAVVIIAVVGLIVGLSASGLLSRFGSAPPSTAGLIAVPSPARTIPAHTRMTRDHLWDPKNQRLSFIYLPPQ